MSILPPKLVKTENYKGTVCTCYHCGANFGTPNGTCALYCSLCKTAETRAAMDKENLKNNPNFKCIYCTAEAEEKKNRKKEDDE